MSATYGLRSSVSSASAALQQSLASRLQERLASRGSTMFTLTWKSQVTPLRRRICRLAASALRTDGSGSSGWPTPQVFDSTNCPSGNLEKRKNKGGCSNLREYATLTAWPTARASDGGKNVRTAEGSAREMERKGGPQDLNQAVSLAAWPTPNAIPEGRGGLQSNPEKALQRRAQGHMLNLDDAAILAAWPPPKNRDHHTEGEGQVSPSLAVVAEQSLGATLNGSPAQTAKPGQLNPAFSLFLMGYNRTWLMCAPSKRKP
jgi:hypothetical protein